MHNRRYFFWYLLSFGPILFVFITLSILPSKAQTRALNENGRLHISQAEALQPENRIGNIHPVRLVSETSMGKFNFTIEVADTPKKKNRGLMFRTKMPADHGMLFVNKKSKIMYMWMKNTPLPLDMLFLDQDGRVRHMVESTLPFSTKIISSNTKVRYVLELNAGIVRATGIRKGQRLKHPILTP